MCNIFSIIPLARIQFGCALVVNSSAICVMYIVDARRVMITFDYSCSQGPKIPDRFKTQDDLTHTHNEPHLTKQT